MYYIYPVPLFSCMALWAAQTVHIFPLTYGESLVDIANRAEEYTYFLEQAESFQQGTPLTFQPPSLKWEDSTKEVSKTMWSGVGGLAALGAGFMYPVVAVAGALGIPAFSIWLRRRNGKNQKKLEEIIEFIAWYLLWLDDIVEYINNCDSMSKRSAEHTSELQ